MDSKKIEIRPCPTYRSTGQDNCRRPDRVIVAEHIYEKQMTPEQIELAREMAQNCLTTHYKNCNFKPPISSKSRPSIKKIQKPVKKTVDKEVLTHESQIGELE